MPRSRSVAVAIGVAVLSAAGAVGSHVRVARLRTDAGWLLERGTAQAEEYSATLDSAAAEKQLALLEQRHEVIDHVQLWQRLEMMLILLAVVATFSSYVLFLFKRLRDQLVDASENLGEAGPRGTADALSLLPR